MKRTTVGYSDYDMLADNPEALEWLRQQDQQQFEMTIKLFVQMKRPTEWKALWKNELDARERFAEDLAVRLFDSFVVRRHDWSKLSSVNARPYVDDK